MNEDQIEHYTNCAIVIMSFITIAILILRSIYERTGVNKETIEREDREGAELGFKEFGE